MATRQYIGARYVPKFYQNSVDGSANWQSNVVYEPLTYVTLTNGHMYISKKQVPATVGTPANNIDYWLDIGSYNGFIDSLQSQINTLNTTVGNLSTAVTDLEPVKTGYVYNKQRKVLFITDSYGTFLTPATDNFPYQFLGCMGCTGDVIAEGGSGFIGNGTAHTFLQLYQSAAVDDYTDIVFAGGYNDKDTFYGTIRDTVRTAIRAVQNDYEKVNIWIVCCGACADSDVNYKLLAPLKGYQQACNFDNVHFINLSSVLMKRDLLAMDGVHPGGDGMFQLGLALAQAIKNQYFGKNETATEQLFFDANDVQKNGYVRSAMNGGVANVRLKSIEVSLNTHLTNITCDGNTPIHIGRIHDSLIQGGEFNYVQGVLYARGVEHTGGNTAFYNIDGYYYLHDQELKFVPMMLAHGYNSWFSMSEIDYFRIPPMNFIGVAYCQ